MGLLIRENKNESRESTIRNNNRLLVKYFKMKITVLAENSVCKANTLNVKPGHVFSLFIEFDERKILFDTGQSDLFIQNAEKMGLDLSQVDYLVISNGHYDHGGGLKHFLKINKKAKIFLHINAAYKFYIKIFGFIPYYVGPDQKVIAQKSRIYFIDEDTQIDDKIILLEGFEEAFPQPEAIKALFEKTHNRFITDRFNHELVMLLIENDEIVLFSGCSHSGIINTIEEVKLFSKAMRIKATFGCFHMNNPKRIKNVRQDYIGELAETPGETDPIFYTGHCNGEKNFLYTKGLMGNKIQTMNPGQVFEV
jgi:7,8-dihydropterin-6-yl-methyl-4-(beta-D-ribofuranosyl)aminobenzene 5'-phosphate synthase